MGVMAQSHHLLSECSRYDHDRSFEHQLVLHCKLITKIEVCMDSFANISLVLWPPYLYYSTELAEDRIIS